MEDRQRLQALLNDIEAELRLQSLWEEVSPPPEAFESQLPFCIDTLRFSQWLQWVFIARFHAILEGAHPLPPQCNVSTMAEEALKGMEPQLAELIELLRLFDAEFDNPSH